MTTRDRTALFLRYREEASLVRRTPRPSSFDPEHPASPSTVRRAHIEPDCLVLYNELTGDIAELEKGLDHLAALFAKHLLPSFGDTDTSHLERDIRTRSHRLTQLLHAVERKVRSLTNAPVPPGTTDDAATVERQISANLQKRFAAPLQALSVSFRKKQKSYLEKLQEQRETYADPPPSKVGALVDVAEGSGDADIRGADFVDTQLLTVENANVLAEERTRELTRVAENVNDLATLVKDIAALVLDQGTVLDRVDYNLEDTKLKTHAAARELRIADRYQSKRHALCCIILLAVSCGVMFTILVLKWTS